MNFISQLRTKNKIFNDYMLLIAGIILVLGMMLIVINGIIRMFMKSFGGTVEIVSWCAAIAIIFSLGATQVTKGHVYIDLLFNKFPKFLQKIIEFITITLSILFFSIVTFKLFEYGLKVKDTGTLSNTLGVPYWPIILTVSLGFVSLTITLIIELIYLLFNKGEGDESWNQEQLL